MIGIVEYGSGNVTAIANVLATSNTPHRRVSKPADLDAVDRLILPGVGAFDAVMQRLGESGLRDGLEKAVHVDAKPVLGICVGMQVLSSSSEEGSLPGLGWIPGRVKRIDETRLTSKPKLPHMGWNSIRLSGEPGLFQGIDLEHGFYFLHSFCFECESPESEIAFATYGNEFSVAVRNGNVYGVQFHPEKSHRNGTRLIANFAEL